MVYIAVISRFSDDMLPSKVIVQCGNFERNHTMIVEVLVNFVFVFKFEITYQLLKI